MQEPIHLELRRVFELATLRREADKIQSGRQWQEVRNLKSRCSDARTMEKDLFAARYDTRVEARRRQLIAQAGSKTRDFKPVWAGVDRFSNADTLRQAQRDVRAAHERRIQQIDEYERVHLKGAVERFQAENRMRDIARTEFNRVADRRARPRSQDR